MNELSYLAQAKVMNERQARCSVRGGLEQIGGEAHQHIFKVGVSQR